MSHNVEDFKSNFNQGGARPNKFNVIVPVGSFAGVDSTAFDNKFSFSCKAASIPDMPIGFVPLWYRGRSIQVVGDSPTPDPWTITVYCDEDFLVRDAFERWRAALNQPQGNIMTSGVTNQPSTYKIDLVYQHLSHASEKMLKQYLMIGAFPISIGAVETDYENGNQVITFQVQFVFDYWGSNTNDGLTGGAIS